MLLALEILLALSAVIVGITQVVVPLWNDTPTFPAIRHRKRTAEVASTNDVIVDLALRRQAKLNRERIARETADLRGSRAPSSEGDNS